MPAADRRALPSMLMAVMHIRIVCVGVLDRLVDVEMGMRFLAPPVGAMLMLVVFVVYVRVLVLQG